MDKSEGKDFFSKTFGSLGKKVAKLYHKGQKTASLSNLKRSKKEKMLSFGNKVYMMFSSGEDVSKKSLEDDLKSIDAIEKEIIKLEKDIETIGKASTKTKGSFAVKNLSKEDKTTATKKKKEKNENSEEKPKRVRKTAKTEENKKTATKKIKEKTEEISEGTTFPASHVVEHEGTANDNNESENK